MRPTTLKAGAISLAVGTSLSVIPFASAEGSETATETTSTTTSSIPVSAEAAPQTGEAAAPPTTATSTASRKIPQEDLDKQDQRVRNQKVVTRNEAELPSNPVPQSDIKEPVRGGADNARGDGDHSVIGQDSDAPQLRGDNNAKAEDASGTATGGFGTPGKPMDRGTSGKAQGSGKWGYVGDIAVAEPGNPALDSPHLYGLDIDEKTNQLVVTSNGKCANFFGVWCFGDAGVKKYDLTNDARDTAQYEGNGYFDATVDKGSDGVGKSFDDGKSGVALTLPAGKEWLTPRGVYVDPETREIYITDSNGGPGKTTGEIRKFDSEGNFVASFGGGTKDPAQRLENPYGLAGYTNPVTGTKEIYTISYGDQSVRVFDSNGTYLRSFKTVQSPWGLDVDEKTGDIYVATHQYQRAIRVYDNAGNVKGDIVIPTEIADQLADTKVAPSDDDAAFRERGHAMGVKIDQDTGIVMVWDQNGFDTDRFKGINGNDVANYRDKGGRVWFFKVGEFNKESKAHPENNPIPLDVLQLDQAAPGSLWNGSMGKQAPRGVVMDDLGLVYATTQQWDGSDQDPKLESRIQIYGKTPDPVTGAEASMFTAVTTREKTAEEKAGENAGPDSTVTTTEIYAPGDKIDEATPVAVLRWKNAERGFHQSAQKDTVLEVSYDDGKTWTQYSTAQTGSNGEENVAYVAVPNAERNKTYYFRITPFNEAGSGDPVIVAASLPDPNLKIDKKAELTGDKNGNGLAEIGETITYTITVAAGADAVANVDVTDPMLKNDTLTCNRQDVLNVLSGDEKLVCTAQHVVTEADIAAAAPVADGGLDIVNTATANGKDPLNPEVPVSAVSATATVAATTTTPASTHTPPSEPTSTEPTPTDKPGPTSHSTPSGEPTPRPGTSGRPTPSGEPVTPHGPIIVVPPSQPTTENVGQAPERGGLTGTTPAPAGDGGAPGLANHPNGPGAQPEKGGHRSLANTGSAGGPVLVASALLLLLSGAVLRRHRRS